MQNLSESLMFIGVMLIKMQSGLGVSSSMQAYLDDHNSNFSKNVGYFLFCIQNDKSWREKIRSNLSENLTYLTLFEILSEGIQGNPIYTKLQELEKSIYQQIDDEMERQIQSLPFKIMLPVFIFLLPAYLILLFGPITLTLIKGLQ